MRMLESFGERAAPHRGAIPSASAPPRSLAAWLVSLVALAALGLDARPSAAQAPVRVVARPALSPFTPSFVENLRAIRATDAGRRDDVFMKVGDSSTVSRGFLECLSRDDEIELAGHGELRGAIDHFRGGDAGGRDPFRRQSLAAAEGWSARHVLSGRPSPLLAELRATQARFAFVMNGGNDVEARDDYHYATRMMRIVELLTGNGVIPILSSVPPRRDPEADLWVGRYNDVSWAIARAYALPYLDYHQIMLPLPRQGLASDGVHPNALIVGGRARACDFRPPGLAHGHNARNLLALRALDRLWRTVVEGGDAAAPAGAPLAGAGTTSDPFVVRELPFADRRDTRAEGSAAIDAYPSCGEQDESGREIVYRLEIDRPLTVRITAVGRRDADLDVHLLGELRGDACVERGDRAVTAALAPGTWHVVVDTFAEGGAARAGEVLVMIVPAGD